jgi:hypothetical protein
VRVKPLSTDLAYFHFLSLISFLTRASGQSKGVCQVPQESPREQLPQDRRVVQGLDAHGLHNPSDDNLNGIGGNVDLQCEEKILAWPAPSPAIPQSWFSIGPTIKAFAVTPVR